MGNCLEACKIRNGDQDLGTSLEASNEDECSIKDFYRVHLEDVLLKNPHESVEKMDRGLVIVEEEKKVKKLRFCEEMEDVTKSCEKTKKSACNTTSNVRKRDGLRVTFVLRKEEAATLIRLMQEQDGGGGKTLEELIEELIGAPCSKPNNGEDVWRPVLPTIPEDESMD